MSHIEACIVSQDNVQVSSIARQHLYHMFVIPHAHAQMSRVLLANDTAFVSAPVRDIWLCILCALVVG